ncbi:hypothetical protein EZV62_009168 [Acer yangbiense]|uniref:Uncharacterized protein n=1 Tax=Acer yangbiense TaxID=1000413 RepID=A0A5C7IF96_9ROSI|nr:hypothetical protein EZV62_009168 [Acer yangbiense]
MQEMSAILDHFLPLSLSHASFSKGKRLIRNSKSEDGKLGRDFKSYDDDEELLPPNEEERSEEQDSRYGPNIGALHNGEMDKERDRIVVLLMKQ